MPRICEACAFSTKRLLVSEWHTAASDERCAQDLAPFVVGLMTEPVTRSLPECWQGEYSLDRANKWIAERDSEGPTLLIVDGQTGDAVGLIILFETPAENGTNRVDIRLGYLLVESTWGKGLASEVVEGFVGWCRDEVAIESVAGGVEPENVASARVLEKNGFRPAAEEYADSDGDRIYELKLRR